MRFILLSALLLVSTLNARAEETPNITSEWQLKAITLKSGAVMKGLVLDAGTKVFIDDGGGRMDFSSVEKIEDVPEAEKEALKAEIEWRREAVASRKAGRKPPPKPTKLKPIGNLAEKVKSSSPTQPTVEPALMPNAENQSTSENRTSTRTPPENPSKHSYRTDTNNDYPQYNGDSGSSAIAIVFAFCVVIPIGLPIVIFAFYLYRWRARNEEEYKRKCAINDRIFSNIRALSLKRRQMVIRDAYGNTDLRKWRNEQKYFITTVLHQTFDKSNSYYLISLIDDAIDRHEITERRQDSPHILPLVSGMTGLEYEHHCAMLLEHLGWTTRVTKASGDQGVDVIAERGGRKVAIQCKLYSSPVGNKAVQEVIAAKQYEDADLAVVVSNNSYTQSAQELASKSGVLLLHHSELDKIN